MFRYITLPMIAPFLMVAVIIRSIDALKSFDIIYAITQGGPGTASETINLYLYSVAFAYYDIGYGSAIAVVFFVLIVALSLLCSICASARTGTRREARYESAPDPRHDRALRVAVIVLIVSPARPVLPLDALAFAEVRGRQRRLSAGPHPGALRLEELRAGLRRRTTSASTSSTA